VLLEGSGQRFTAQSLHAAVLACAAELVEADVTAVALYADNSPGWITVDLACQQAGIRLVPLPLFFSTSQLQHAVETSGVDAIISDRPGQCGEWLDTAVAAVSVRAIPGFYCAPIDPTIAVLPPGTDKITFTSGSTGEPKGVCLTSAHQWAIAESLSEQLQLPGVRHLSVLPLSTLLENVAGVYTALLANGAVVVPSLTELGLPGGAGLELPRLLASISRHQPSSLIATSPVVSFWCRSCSRR